MTETETAEGGVNPVELTIPCPDPWPPIPIGWEPPDLEGYVDQLLARLDQIK